MRLFVRYYPYLEVFTLAPHETVHLTSNVHMWFSTLSHMNGVDYIHLLLGCLQRRFSFSKVSESMRFCISCSRMSVMESLLIFFISLYHKKPSPIKENKNTSPPKFKELNQFFKIQQTSKKFHLKRNYILFFLILFQKRMKTKLYEKI